MRKMTPIKPAISETMSNNYNITTNLELRNIKTNLSKHNIAKKNHDFLVEYVFDGTDLYLGSDPNWQLN